MSVTVPYNFEPRDYQLDVFRALDNGIRRVFMKWPRRHGKDKTCWIYMITAASRVVGNYYYVFPQKVDARRALWTNIDTDGFRTLDHLPQGVIHARREQDMVIQLNNGSFIQFLGLDDPDKIRGVAAKGVVFSEFAYQPEDGHKIFGPVLKESGGWAIYQSTPQGRNHFYEMDKRIINSPDWLYSSFQCLWPDKDRYEGRFISPTQLEEVQRDMGFDDNEMAREYGVSYGVGSAGAYYAHSLEKAWESDRIGAYPPEDHKLTDLFWDLGRRDGCAIWFRQIHQNKVVWIDYFEADGEDVAFYVDILRGKGYNYRTHYLPHDGRNKTLAAAKTTAELLSDLCEEVRISNEIVLCSKDYRVIDGINRVRADFSRYHFNLGMCSDAVDKLGLYHKRYDRIRRVFLDEPLHDINSHCADALRMSVSPEAMEQENPLRNQFDRPIQIVASNFDAFEPSQQTYQEKERYCPIRGYY